MQKFQEVTAGSDKISRRHIIVLAHYFGVAREAMVRRLEELSLVKPETWDWFEANGGITDEHARQVLGDLAVPDLQKAEADRPTTLRLNLLAAEAAERGPAQRGPARAAAARRSRRAAGDSHQRRAGRERGRWGHQPR